MWGLQEEPARDSPMRLTEMLCGESCLLGIKNWIEEEASPVGPCPSVLFVHLSFCFVTVLAARTFLNKPFFNVNFWGVKFFYLMHRRERVPCCEPT